MENYNFKILEEDIVDEYDNFTFNQFKKKLSKFPKCPRCEKEWNNIRILKNKTSPIVADYIEPLAFGGTRTIKNIQPMCVQCNKKKLSEERDRYYEYVENQNKEHEREANKRVLMKGLLWFIALTILWFVGENYGGKGVAAVLAGLAFVIIIIFLLRAPDLKHGDDGL